MQEALGREECGRRGGRWHRKWPARPASRSKWQGGMTSDQLFNNSAKSLQADERRPLLKALFGCGRLEGIDRSLLVAMTGQAFLDHSDRFEPSRFGQVWPWLFKRFRSIGYRCDHRRLAIQVDGMNAVIFLARCG